MDKVGSKSCRICISDSMHLTSIFTLQMGGELTIADMLTSFCSFQLTEDGDSFDQICGKCSKETLNAYNFKLKCEKSHELLVRRAKESDAEMEHKFPSFETVNMDYIDPDSETDDTKLGLLHTELDLPCLDIKSDYVPTESAGTESFRTQIIEGPLNKDAEGKLLPTVTDVDEEDHAKVANFVMKFHSYALTGPMQFHCSMCSYTCDHESKLKTHVMFLHSRKEWRRFESRLNKPKAPRSRKKRYTCDSCGFSCIQKLDLTEHFLKHTGQKPHQCTICGIFVRYRRGLRIHMKTHSSEKPHACDKCDYVSKEKRSLNVHILRKHTLMNISDKNGWKPFKCGECSFSSGSAPSLRMHKLTHTGMKLYKCNKCPYFTTIENNLTAHSLTHSRNKLFSCNLCGKSFTTKPSLTVHIRIHTGEKPYSCSSCDFSTSNRTYLKIHERIHSGEKPFACDVCSRSFTNKKSLIIHMLTHSGVKAFSCERCDRSFALKRNLKAHMLTHTRERPFSCHQCDYSISYTRNSALKTHMLSHADTCTE